MPTLSPLPGRCTAVGRTWDLVLVRRGTSTPERRAEMLRSLRSVVECFPFDSRDSAGGAT